MQNVKMKKGGTGRQTTHQTLTSLSLSPSQKNCEYEQDWIYKQT